MHQYHQGLFKPKNPKKYKGNPNKIVYRSAWEWEFMDEFDRNPSIVSWQSEEFYIPYADPLNSRPRRYFPDFLIEKRTTDNKIVKQIIEVKPLDQCFQPKKRKNTRAYKEECVTYLKNLAKWKAAKKYCAQRNIEFIVFSKHPKTGQVMLLTEKEIGF